MFFRLILVAILAYIGYSFYKRYIALSNINKSSRTRSSKNKYSKMNIRDAEFEDIENGDGKP